MKRGILSFLIFTFIFIVSFLVAITPGIIQQAHFATPESTLTFWLFLTLFLIILWHSKKKFIYLVVAASALGVAAATKIVAITFLPLFILVQLSKFKLKLIPLIKNIATLLASISFIALAFAAVFPYSLIDWTSFRSSIEYETGVGNGSILVFYTRQFLDTPSFVFQYQKILAFALGPSLTALGTAGGFLIIYQVIFRFFRRKKGVNPEILILTLAFFSLFLPNAILFAKWTRFIAPTFAFWSFFAAHLIQSISETFKKRFSSVTGFFLYFLLVTTFLWAVMFFSIYKRPDIRITATNWIIKNIPANSFILTEAGNMVEVPIWGGIDKKNFDFYNLDENPSLDEELVTYLAKADYFIVQSRRMFTNHQRFPDKFPLTARFYDFLFSERLGFTKIKDFNSFPGLSFAGKTLAVNDEAAEETWSVFDHPVIRIYKKVRPLTEYQYAKLLKI